MSLQFAIDKAGNRSFVQTNSVVETDALETVVFLFPTSTAITISIAETQGAQTDSVVIKETYSATISESQAHQTDSIVVAETYKATIAESQAAQTESIVVSEKYTATITENQAAQSDSITVSEKYNVSLVESQAAQTESIVGTVGSTGVNASIVEAQALQVDAITVSVPVVPSPPPQIQSGGGGIWMHGWNTQWQRPKSKKKKKPVPVVFVEPKAEPKPVREFTPLRLEDMFPHWQGISKAKTPGMSLKEMIEKVQKAESTHTNTMQRARKLSRTAKRRRREQELLI